MGDYLITGYGLYSWHERRLPGLEYGSASYAKHLDVFGPRFSTTPSSAATATATGATVSSSATV